MEVPRLPKGKMFLGPEAYGCCNTGTRPTIAHSRFTGKYVVGAQNDVEQVLNSNKILGRKRVIHLGSRTAWVFKTRKPAVAKFEELVAERQRFNEDLRREHEEARQAAQEGDLGAALRLGDF